MAQIVFLRGVNVGGHRTFRPAALAKELRDLDVVNVGAAGTFVVRNPISRTRLREEFARRLPFETEIVMCDSRDLARLLSRDRFSDVPAAPNVVHFVSVLSRKPRLEPELPMTLPPSGPWLLKVLGRDGPFVIGAYRRDMKAIGQLGMLDRHFGVPMTARSWNTIVAIAKVVNNSGSAQPR